MKNYVRHPFTLFTCFCCPLYWENELAISFCHIMDRGLYLPYFILSGLGVKTSSMVSFKESIFLPSTCRRLQGLKYFSTCFTFHMKLNFGIGGHKFPTPYIKLMTRGRFLMVKEKSLLWKADTTSDVSRDFGEVADFSRGFFGGGSVMLPCGFSAKPWWGPGSKTPRSSKDLVLWKYLLLIKICPPKPVMKLIHYICSKIFPKFELEVNFNIQYWCIEIIVSVM